VRKIEQAVGVVDNNLQIFNKVTTDNFSMVREDIVKNKDQIQGLGVEVKDVDDKISVTGVVVGAVDLVAGEFEHQQQAESKVDMQVSVRRRRESEASARKNSGSTNSRRQQERAEERASAPRSSFPCARFARARESAKKLLPLRPLRSRARFARAPTSSFPCARFARSRARFARAPTSSFPPPFFIRPPPHPPQPHPP
jgi:hypothetical protein